MVDPLWIDLETFSETPINHGTFAYAADAEIMLVAYAIGDGPVSVWDLTAGDSMPEMLRAALADESTPIIAHNAQFDANILWKAKNSDGVLWLAGANVERWRCTMAQALSHALPAKLSALGEVLHLPPELLKDDGYDLVMLFCKPLPKHSSLRRATRATHPEEWARFVRYAGQDIVAMRECARRMPNWNWQPRDIALWHYDQRINRRGFAVDRELAEVAVEVCKTRARENADKVVVLTDGEVERVTQRDRLIRFVLAEHGVDLPDLRATTLERRVEDDSLPWAVRELLALRLSGSKSSVSKYRTLLRGVSTDGRLRGGLQFRGAARTGRDAGRLFQPQNLPRPKNKAAAVEQWIEMAKLDALDIVGFDDVQLASDALRGCIIAEPGHKLVQADFSNIEGRIVAWYADEEWKLDAFRAFDAGTGPDLYRVTASRAFRKPIEMVTGDDRQIGKVVELACGFQGAVGAFQTMAAVYGVSIPDAQAKRMVYAWRDAHPGVVALWRRLETAASMAVANPGSIHTVGRIRFARRGPWLKMQLPSGRILSYPHIEFDPSGALKFKGQNQYTRKWGDVWTYGGKLLENAVQATAADLLWAAVIKAEQGGYPVVLRVHDELITEPTDDPRFNVDGLCALMTDAPAWAKGLPIAAAGFEARRYRKG